MSSNVLLFPLSSVEDLKSKFCSTVANDIMLVSTLGVIRMWADEASRKSRFRILFTTYQERKSALWEPTSTLTHPSNRPGILLQTPWRDQLMRSVNQITATLL